MKGLFLSLLTASIMLLSGCVVAPAGYYHRHAVVVAPVAPVVVVHPVYRW
jgi:hypothetical protein